MKKVYLVFRGTDSWYGDGYFIRAYSRRKFAERFIKDVSDKSFLYIKEVDLNVGVVI